MGTFSTRQATRRTSTRRIDLGLSFSSVRVAYLLSWVFKVLGAVALVVGIIEAIWVHAELRGSLVWAWALVGGALGACVCAAVGWGLATLCEVHEHVEELLERPRT